MALIPDGREVGTETGVNRSGKDLDGNPVVVSASHEAIHSRAGPSFEHTKQAGSPLRSASCFELNT
ncbi:MAG: hypothetical protein OSA43_10185 [Pirellulales bacterium]|nr:hypothetical protein [Pirellulales bacterium]